MNTDAITTSVRMTREQMKKLERLAALLNVSRNRTIGLLIDTAIVEQAPMLRVMPRGERDEQPDCN